MPIVLSYNSTLEFGSYIFLMSRFWKHGLSQKEIPNKSNNKMSTQSSY